MADHATRVEIAAGLVPQGLLMFGVVAALATGMLRRGTRISLFPALSGIVLAGAGGGAIVELVFLNRNHMDVATLYDGALVVDRLSIFITILACVIGGFAVLAMGPVLERVRPHVPEAHAFILAAVLGTAVVGSAAEMASLTAGTELLALSLVVLTAIAKTESRAVAAGLRMLLVNGVGTALLLYGFVLLYGLSGRTEFAAAGASLRPGPAAALAVTLVLAGLVVMLGAVPFGHWLDEASRHSLGPVAGLSSALGATAATAALVRVTALGLPGNRAGWSAIAAVFAALSMVYGAFRALRATDLRHLAGALGLAQAGVLLVAVAGQAHLLGQPSPAGVSAALIQLVALAAALMLAGAVVGVLEHHGEGAALRDLSDRGPVVAVMAAIAIVSLSGLPPTVGFVAGINAVAAGAVGGYGWLAVVAAASLALTMLAGVRALALVYAAHSVAGHPSLDPLGDAARSTKVAVVSLSALVAVVLPLLLAPLSQLAAGAAGPLTR